ncbi:MAG TPA: hypothetical protein VF517_13660 [Thermoleophilaceae bacterium]
MGKASYTLAVALIARSSAPRALAALAAVIAFAAAPAGAQTPAPHPLTGKGQNFEIVANVPMDGGSGEVAASDLELHGDYAFVGSYGEGMVVVDISNPFAPKRVGKFDCPGGQNDIQLSPDGKTVAMAIDTTANECHPNDEGTSIIDVSDPAQPKEIAWIDKKELPRGSHNNTLDWPYLYVDQYSTAYSQLEIFDLSTPSVPRKVGELSYGGEDSVHDLSVDHRPDGRSFAYAASIGFTDVIDVTDPRSPILRERVQDPQVTISHQAEANFDRTLLLVTDEFNGGASYSGACGGSPITRVPFPTGAPAVGDPQNIGALHIYRLDPSGNIAGSGGLDKAGTFNIPYQANDEPSAGCTIHVFWQAPDENRMVTAWYGRGTRAIDYSNPAAPKELGYFIPTGSDTWAAKPHRGFIYTGDILRGMDVLRYKGEGGARWPATSGPAELQRARQQGASPPVPTGAPAPAQPAPQQGEQPQPTQGPRLRVGRRVFTKHVRVPDVPRKRKAELVLSFYKNKGLVTRLRLRTRDRRIAKLRTQAAGLAGHYRYTIRLGDRGRFLARGIVRVRRSDTTRVELPAGQALICRVSAK